MEAMRKKEATATACSEDNRKGVHGVSMNGLYDPWNPAYPPRDPSPCDADMAAHIASVKEWMDKTQAILANSRATNIIIPDRTPQFVNDVLFDILPALVPILEKDNVRSFLRFFNENGRAMSWGFIITPETLNQIIVSNAVRCAKVVLVGDDPELHGFRANPNCMTQYGYFSLHRAADMFSVDMIELLLRHGASANLRTSGDLVPADLLPLHVAVENTSMHKYLEDSLNPSQQRVDCSQADINYILKLIHILCLPEMKIFLDTTRLLAKHTDDLLDELCKYIVDGKIVHTAVLLLAAQKQIRGLSSCNGCGSSKKDGFGTITNFVVDNITAIKMRQNRLEMEPLEVKKELLDVTLNLVHVIFKAGEALDVYIRSHPKIPCVMEVAHAEVFEHVTLILKDHGFFSIGDGIDIGNLHPYRNVLSSQELPHKLAEMARIKAGLKVPCLRNGKILIDQPKVKKDPRGWELKFARRSFFQSQRSVLTSELSVKFFAHKEKTSDKSTGKASMFMGGTLQPKFNYQPRRMFGTVALTLLKALRKA
ncbi:hypothetical protein VPH35_035474 [Triticum aestivum]